MAKERLEVILSGLKRLFMQERKLFGKENTEATRMLIVGKIDGLCEELEKEVERIKREHAKDKEVLEKTNADLEEFEGFIRKNNELELALDHFLSLGSRTTH